MEESNTHKAVHIYRIVVWVAVLIGMGVTVARPFPVFPDVTDAIPVNTGINYYDAVAQAQESYDASKRLTESAIQQQVANGWLTNDLLLILTQQQSEALARARTAQAASDAAAQLEQERWEWEMKDRRVESIIVLIGLGVALHLAGSAVIALIGGRSPKPTRSHTPLDPNGSETFASHQPPSPSVTHAQLPQGTMSPPPNSAGHQWPGEPPSGYRL